MKNVFETVTNRLVEAIESGMGLKEWIKPFVSVKPVNFTSGHKYVGLLNLMNLGYETVRKGYEMPFWASFLQVQKAGGLVKAGEKATFVLFSKTMEVKPESGEISAEEGTDKRRTYRVFRLSPVFNIAQTNLNAEGFRERLGLPTRLESDEACEAAEATIKRIPHHVSFGAEMPCYSPATDEIRLPNRVDFDSHQNFIAVYLHELAHWAGAGHRLNRLTKAAFGTPEYAREELVAELASAYWCAEFGIDSDKLQHPGYLQSWLLALKQDARYIFDVAHLAKQAVEFLQKQAKA